MVTNNNRGNPEFANMGRKFNIAVSGSRDDYAHTHINDIGLQAVANQDGQSASQPAPPPHHHHAPPASHAEGGGSPGSRPACLLCGGLCSTRCDGVQCGGGRVLLDEARGHERGAGPVGAARAGR